MAEPLAARRMTWRSQGWPVVGHFPHFQADTTGFLLRIARQQGDVARFRLGRTEAMLLSHPDQVRAVLVERAGEFTKGRLMHRARRLLGDGLLTSEGEVHRCNRRRMQPVFARERLQAYAALVPDLARAHVAGWHHGSRIRIDAAMDGLAMRVVARTLLGQDIEEKVPGLMRALRRLARWAPLLVAPGGAVLENIRVPTLGSIHDAIETVEGIIDRQIAEGPEDSALLGALIHKRADSVSARLVRDEVMTIFLAGHDTTAAALTWTWLLLGNHPAIELRLRNELASVLGGREPAISDLGDLPYMEMVVKEALRLYPPIGRIGRRPVHDVSMDGLVLPKHSAVFVSPFVTQRDSRWFVEPDEFRPERWNESGDRPRFAWFPFGAGPRSCVGEQFARVVLALTIATIAQHWRLKPVIPALPRARSLLTVKPRGPVWMIPQTLPPL